MSREHGVQGHYGLDVVSLRVASKSFWRYQGQIYRTPGICLLAICIAAIENLVVFLLGQDVFARGILHFANIDRIVCAFDASTPMLKFDLDRDLAEQMDVKVSDVFTALQAQLGSLYVNDFTSGGKNYHVNIQADLANRATVDQLRSLHVPGADGAQVPVTGGAYGAGIGGGLQGAGGEVVIRNGAVKVLAGENASVIGHGSGKDNDGTVSISGGIFGMSVADGWCADGCEVRDNPDPASAADYPWTVVLFVAVTLEGLSEHATAAYTFGDGSVTNAVEGTNFKVVWGTENVKVIFMPVHNYRFRDAQETGVRALDSPIKADVAVTSPEVEGIPGTDAAPWPVGESVTAYVSDEGVLVIGGTGAMSDFASAADVPWNPALVTAVQVANGVTLGKNALAGFADEVLVAFGSPVLSVGSMKGAMGASEPVIPEGKVLVSKEEIAAAKTETVTVEGGAVSLGVTVNTNGDLTAETKSWQPVELKGENVKVENGKIVITIPVDSQSGFMILQSGDASVPTE